MSSGSSGSSRRCSRSQTPTSNRNSAALEAVVSNPHRHRRDRTRSRSPHHESHDGDSHSETSRSGSTRSRTSRSGNSRVGAPRNEAPRDGAPRNGTPREEAPRNGTPRQEHNVKISHILIKHKESRRPIDNNDKPVTRTKDQAMHIVIDIHKKISRDLITFADAAVSYSECTSARRQGDIQNQFKVGRVQKSFEDAALSLAPGQVSHIIESNSGYHILQRRE